MENIWFQISRIIIAVLKSASKGLLHKNTYYHKNWHTLNVLLRFTIKTKNNKTEQESVNAYYWTFRNYLINSKYSTNCQCLQKQFNPQYSTPTLNKYFNFGRGYHMIWLETGRAKALKLCAGEKSAVSPPCGALDSLSVCRLYFNLAKLKINMYFPLHTPNPIAYE